MLNILKRYQRHRSIKRYIKDLGPSLKKRYGANEYYTEGQIRTTLEKYKIGGKYASYAYGLYLAPKELEGILDKLNESKSAKNMRIYLSTNYIRGSIDYSYTDIMASTSSGSNESSSSASDFSIGDSGGDGGGGD